MWPNLRETSDLVTIAQEILNGKLSFCAVILKIYLYLLRKGSSEKTSPVSVIENVETFQKLFLVWMTAEIFFIVIHKENWKK